MQFVQLCVFKCTVGFGSSSHEVNGYTLLLIQVCEVSCVACVIRDCKRTNLEGFFSFFPNEFGGWFDFLLFRIRMVVQLSATEDPVREDIPVHRGIHFDPCITMQIQWVILVWIFSWHPSLLQVYMRVHQQLFKIFNPFCLFLSLFSLTCLLYEEYYFCRGDFHWEHVDKREYF